MALETAPVLQNYRRRKRWGDDAYMRIGQSVADDWGPQIRRFRRLRAIKQNALAEQLGVDQATVSRWESGRQVPDLGMQRRLRALMRGAEPRDEVLLKHWIDTALGYTMLTDAQRTILAASPSFCVLHEVAAPEIVGMSAVPTFTDELERSWWIAVEHGFFDGEVASVTVVSRFHTLSGRRRFLGAISVWTPVHLTTGEVLCRADRISLTDEEFARAREQNGGPIRIVRMDELSL